MLGCVQVLVKGAAAGEAAEGAEGAEGEAGEAGEGARANAGLPTVAEGPVGEFTCLAVDAVPPPPHAMAAAVYHKTVLYSLLTYNL